MKKLILATVSSVGLLTSHAFAAEGAIEPTTSNEAAAMAQEAAQAVYAPANEAAQPMEAVVAAYEAPQVTHAAATMPAPKPTEKPTEKMVSSQTKMHMKKSMGGKPKLTARHHVKHPSHMGHRHPYHMEHRGQAAPYMMGGYYNAPHYMPGENVIIDGQYVAFPPMDMYGRIMVAPTYYKAKKECPYICHGGYFWYPHLHANLLKGYNPYQHGNYYWYASHMHPYTVYTDRTRPVFVYPHPLHIDHEMYMQRHRGQ